MRRKEKEIHDQALMEAIINRALVCRLGLSDGLWPYVVPLCFGYQDKTLFVHSALEGKKIRIIQQNPRVCFELDIDTELQQADTPCRWGTSYRSIIGYGHAEILTDPGEKRHGLGIIMDHYSEQIRPEQHGSDQPWPEGQWHFPKTALAKTAVIKIAITEMTGKQSGY